MQTLKNIMKKKIEFLWFLNPNILLRLNYFSSFPIYHFIRKRDEEGVFHNYSGFKIVYSFLSVQENII